MWTENISKTPIQNDRCSVDGKQLTRFQSENAVCKFLQRGVHGKHFMRFQSKNAVCKFLPRSVDGARQLKTRTVSPLRDVPHEFHVCLHNKVYSKKKQKSSRRPTCKTKEQRTEWLLWSNSKCFHPTGWKLCWFIVGHLLPDHAVAKDVKAATCR